jgi:hypothetical protein
MIYFSFKFQAVTKLSRGITFELIILTLYHNKLNVTLCDHVDYVVIFIPINSMNQNNSMLLWRDHDLTTVMPVVYEDRIALSISLSHAAIFGWHFSRSLRDKSTKRQLFIIFLTNDGKFAL